MTTSFKDENKVWPDTVWKQFWSNDVYCECVGSGQTDRWNRRKYIMDVPTDPVWSQLAIYVSFRSGITGGPGSGFPWKILWFSGFPMLSLFSSFCHLYFGCCLISKAFLNSFPVSTVFEFSFPLSVDIFKLSGFLWLQKDIFQCPAHNSAECFPLFQFYTTFWWWGLTFREIFLHRLLWNNTYIFRLETNTIVVVGGD